MQLASVSESPPLRWQVVVEAARSGDSAALKGLAVVAAEAEAAGFYGLAREARVVR